MACGRLVSVLAYSIEVSSCDVVQRQLGRTVRRRRSRHGFLQLNLARSNARSNAVSQGFRLADRHDVACRLVGESMQAESIAGLPPVRARGRGVKSKCHGCAHFAQCLRAHRHRFNRPSLCRPTPTSLTQIQDCGRCRVKSRTHSPADRTDVARPDSPQCCRASRLRPRALRRAGSPSASRRATHAGNAMHVVRQRVCVADARAGLPCRSWPPRHGRTRRRLVVSTNGHVRS